MLTKSLIALAGFIVLSVAYELLVPDSELKSVLGDPSKSENVFKCILGSGNDLCDAVGKAFKDILQDVINTDCANCNKEQHDIIGQFFASVSVKDPEKIKKTSEKYDPRGENLKKHSASWKGKGIKI